MRNTLRILLLFCCSLIPLARAQRPAVEGHQGMVVSAQALATAAGVEILRQGGNAVDAAVATGFALAVVYPRAGNLGGGGFMIVHTAANQDIALDFRETAPAAARPDMYLDAAGQVVPGRSTTGYLASGVPGTVAGLEHAWKHYGSGRINWVQIIEPARELAADGFVISPALAQDLAANQALLRTNEASQQIFLPHGKPPAAGDRLVQEDLAATLERLQADGAGDFYRGHTATLIAADQERGHGLISRGDLAGYKVVERPVIRGRYRGYAFVTMPPPSSGGIALQQMLGMLEPFDLHALGLHSAADLHLLTEVMRRAFRDRAKYLGDPDFGSIPTAELTAPDHIARLMANFDPHHATSSDTLAPGSIPGHESTETTHFAAVDAAGNVATCTYTLNGLYGSGVTAAGTGVLLNNEMDDFTAKVGVKNMFGLLQSEANAVAPGKRPLSSMTPTIVLRDGKPFLVTGSPGGPTIITTVLQVILNVIDHRMPLTLAVDAPRMHHQWQPDEIFQEPFLTSPEVLATLESMGHTLALRHRYGADAEAAARYWGDAESIMIDPASGTLLGVSDRRSADAAAAGF